MYIEYYCTLEIYRGLGFLKIKLVYNEIKNCLSVPLKRPKIMKYVRVFQSFIQVLLFAYAYIIAKKMISR